MGGVTLNKDLKNERRNATFDVEQMTYFLDGGEQNTKRRREIEAKVLNNEAYGDPMEFYHLNRDEKYTDCVRRCGDMIEDLRKSNLTHEARNYAMMAFPNETAPVWLHTGMFTSMMRGQTTEEQKIRWLDKTLNLEIIGTYAQTELGHGSHVRGLETTATYDPKTEEFVIHSPTLTATKWWPGGLGMTSNCVALMAQLYTRGQCYGVHPFFVQIRDFDTHEPLPGITVGDIGPKIGYMEFDNGFLHFNHVRIPRENLLSKNAEVSKDGAYVRKHQDQKKLSYGTMMETRAGIVEGNGTLKLTQACTIAVRYSAVRRQSKLDPDGVEPQVLDYQTQQYKLFPILATAYAHVFISIRMKEMRTEIGVRTSKGETDLFPEMHALSSCMKAFTTDHMRKGVEQCLLACGGHGYSMASGLPKIYTHGIPGVTYEGENTILYLQTGRYLLKMYQKACKGDILIGSASYLGEKLDSPREMTRDCPLPSLINAYKRRAARCVQKAHYRNEKLKNKGHPEDIARNLTSVSLVAAAKAHAHLILLLEFAGAVSKPEGSLKHVLHQLCQLYALYGITQNGAEFFETNSLIPKDMDIVQSKLYDLLAELRPNAVALVDAFDFPDRLLCSALGRYDGNVYEELYKFAQNSKFNKKEVFEECHKYLQPLRQNLGSKL